MKTHTLPAHLQRFFSDRLTNQLRASANTVASYRDTFRLLLNYACERLGRTPTELQIGDIDAELVGDFLVFLEEKRGNSARSRNTRLAAIRSFFKDVARNEPQLLHHCQRVLAMPAKRYERRPVAYLSRREIEALVNAPDPATWLGERDRALLLLAVQSGLRVSEIVALACEDIHLGTGAHVRCLGKGRKERATPLRKDSVTALRRWLSRRGDGPGEALFITRRGTALSRDAIERLVRKHGTTASRVCPSLADKRLSPHTLRHSAAMELLQNGVDRTVITLWLGHESVETTQMYLHADMEIKERALAKTQPLEAPKDRYRPPDDVLAFLEGL